MNSRAGELYETPVGHDTLAKVLMQLGIPEKVITNKMVSASFVVLSGREREKQAVSPRETTCDSMKSAAAGREREEI